MDCAVYVGDTNEPEGHGFDGGDERASGADEACVGDRNEVEHVTKPDSADARGPVGCSDGLVKNNKKLNTRC